MAADIGPDQTEACIAALGDDFYVPLDAPLARRFSADPRSTS
jgi:hypothetical protein